MSMSQSDFAIAAHLRMTKQYGEFWKVLFEDFELSKGDASEAFRTSSLNGKLPG